MTKKTNYEIFDLFNLVFSQKKFIFIILIISVLYSSYKIFNEKIEYYKINYYFHNLVIGPEFKKKFFNRITSKVNINNWKRDSKNNYEDLKSEMISYSEDWIKIRSDDNELVNMFMAYLNYTHDSLRDYLLTEELQKKVDLEVICSLNPAQSEIGSCIEKFIDINVKIRELKNYVSLIEFNQPKPDGYFSQINKVEFVFNNLLVAFLFSVITSPLYAFVKERNGKND